MMQREHGDDARSAASATTATTATSDISGVRGKSSDPSEPPSAWPDDRPFIISERNGGWCGGPLRPRESVVVPRRSPQTFTRSEAEVFTHSTAMTEVLVLVAGLVGLGWLTYRMATARIPETADALAIALVLFAVVRR